MALTRELIVRAPWAHVCLAVRDKGWALALNAQLGFRKLLSMVGYSGSSENGSGASAP